MAKRFSVEVDDIRLMGEIYFPSRSVRPKPTLCICHGIPAAIPTPNDKGYALLAERFAGEGFLTCIFNFRGCGESEGNLDLLDWTRDLDAILTFLSELEEVDTSRFSVMGFSGGAATAGFVAPRDQRIKSLILCACPARFSIGALGRSPEEFLSQCRSVGTIRDLDFPVSLEEWAEHFRSVSPVDCIEMFAPRPLLIIHGDRDETVPPDHAFQLYDRAKEPKELFIVPGGEHRLRTDARAIEKAVSWLKHVNGLD